MARNPDLRPRRTPRQERSRQTVDAILEAAARVFAARGYEGATTNHIAEVAGVSIGSLYEYFPGKEAILAALAERHTQQMVDEIGLELERAREGRVGARAALRTFVEAMLAVHRRDPVLHRIWSSEAPHPPDLHACLLRTEEALAHGLRALLEEDGDVAHRDLDTAAHLVVQTVEALGHRFVEHGLHDLSETAFTDEVVALVEGYVGVAKPR